MAQGAGLAIVHHWVPWLGVPFLVTPENVVKTSAINSESPFLVLRSARVLNAEDSVRLAKVPVQTAPVSCCAPARQPHEIDEIRKILCRWGYVLRAAIEDVYAVSPEGNGLYPSVLFAKAEVSEKPDDIGYSHQTPAYT